MYLVPSFLRRRGTGLLMNHCVSFYFLSTMKEILLTKSYRISPIILPAALIRGMLTVNPEHRLTLSDVFQHPWCMRYRDIYYFRFTFFKKNTRPSQLAKQSPLDLANKLTQPLRDNGDLQLAAPNLNSSK